MIPRITSATAGALLLLVALTACGSPTPNTTASASPVDGEGTQNTEGSPPSGELTCESMVSTGTVDALTEAGWTAESKEFVVGGITLDSGLLCFWADYTIASDHGQLYGWSPISAADAEKAQASLENGGWTQEESPEGVYVTEDPQYAMGTDDDGYGMTYLFGDGWVKFADTKQSLILIEWAG